MDSKEFHGSCHCGAIKLKARLDIETTTSKCNCNFCRKNAFWSIKGKENNLEILAGEDYLQEYTNDANIGCFHFCKHCSTFLYYIAKKSDWTEAGFGLNLRVLDDMSVVEMNSLTITYLDGKANTWQPITDHAVTKTLY